MLAHDHLTQRNVPQNQNQNQNQNHYCSIKPHWPDWEFLDVALSSVRAEERQGYIERLGAFMRQHRQRLEDLLRAYGPGSKPACGLPGGPPVVQFGSMLGGPLSVTALSLWELRRIRTRFGVTLHA
ncbi:hypothetical protein [Streptomyces buecherae]|uniref:hypothetical protein n=1 Tax=Streptomyces buecherae TaxID=2763006 RepID=UPI00368299D3